MRVYLDLLKKIMEEGTDKADRTGVGTRSIFGAQYRINLQEGFPLLTTKKMFLKGIIYELLWFLTGSTNIRPLVLKGVNIWNEWPFQAWLEDQDLVDQYPRYSDEWKKKMKEFVKKVKEDEEFAKQYGELGPVYGKQWVSWEAADGSKINQIQNAIDLINNDPTSRRILVSAWNVGEIMELVKSHNYSPPACHTLFQFIVVEGKLSCHLYQRTADMFLGVPFNVASYSLLTKMMAQVTGLEAHEFIHSFGDAHIYRNHIDQVKKQLSRKPRPLPKMELNPQVKDIFEFQYEDFTLTDYDPHSAIKAPIAV